MMKTGRLFIAAVALALGASLGACSGDNPAPAPSTTAPATETHASATTSAPATAEATTSAPAGETTSPASQAGDRPSKEELADRLFTGAKEKFAQAGESLSPEKLDYAKKRITCMMDKIYDQLSDVEVKEMWNTDFQTDPSEGLKTKLDGAIGECK
ncbi:MAG: hypothetical protein Q4B12_00660 [Bowdeniella nasicola]|nr:hypothetical protein [Bowdeniella nasicola]